jgi:hypothetical protein
VRFPFANKHTLYFFTVEEVVSAGFSGGKFSGFVNSD